MSADHIQRLTMANRKLQEQLSASNALLRRLTVPDDLGYAVSEEVRTLAAKMLEPGNA